MCHFSPPYHYLAEVALPAFAQLGATIVTELNAWGWNPGGGGEITAAINPITQLQAVDFEPAATDEVGGVTAVSNLPAHIPNRMGRRASNLLGKAGLRASIRELRTRGQGAGAGMVLWRPQAGFTSLGRKGLPAEDVAETAVAGLLAFVENKVAVDKYLADQLLLPMALAHGQATFSTDSLTQHTLTNADLLRQWLDVTIDINGELGQPAQIAVTGNNFIKTTIMT